MTHSGLSARAPIGIFDSGVGGLTVLRQVQRRLPRECVLYLADTANVPYGDKPIEVVRDLALTLTRHLVEAGCKIVIMASGTSTVAGLDAARELFPDTPILGTIEAGARAALSATAGPVGVMSTNGTAQSLAFTHCIVGLSPGREVFEQGCPKFVPLVESGRIHGTEAALACREYLTPVYEAGSQAIILGCTHFPFLLGPLADEAAALSNGAWRPAFVDPSDAVVCESASLLEARGLLARDGDSPDVRFAASGDPEEFRRFAAALLGRPVPPVSLLSL